ncbi:unnamed protein product [Absidia cylindrospora]
MGYGNDNHGDPAGDDGISTSAFTDTDEAIAAFTYTDECKIPDSIGIELFEMFVKHGVSRNAATEIINLINDAIISAYDTYGKKLPSDYQVKQIMKDAFPVVFKQYQCCQKGCRLYSDDDEKI